MSLVGRSHRVNVVQAAYLATLPKAFIEINVGLTWIKS